MNFFVFEDQPQNFNIHPTVVNDQDERILFFFFLLNNLYNNLRRVMEFSFNCMIFRVCFVYLISFVTLVCLVFKELRVYGVVIKDFRHFR